MRFMHIICEFHKKPHKIAFFADHGQGWQEQHAFSADRKREYKAKDETPSQPKNPDSEFFDIDSWLEDARIGDRTLNATFLDGDRPVESLSIMAITDGKARTTYNLVCDRCKKRKTHGTVSRRQEKLFPVLDLLASNGLRDVNITTLAKFCRAWDDQQAAN